MHSPSASFSPVEAGAPLPHLAIIGGTGKGGNALAARFARAGFPVIIGSRDASRGEQAARELRSRLGVTNTDGTSNREAAMRADVVLLALPYEGMQLILEDLKDTVSGKIVINIASSLDTQRKSRAKVPPAGSVTAEVQQFFGDNARVVAAFQNVAPEKIGALDEPIDIDVLVCGSDRETRSTVVDIIRKVGIEAFDAGVLANAVAVETLTAALIAINIRYKTKGAGIRLTGVPRG